MTAQMDPDEFSRISKFFLDRDQETPEQSLARRALQRVVVVCGADVAHSYTLQLALLTVAKTANRCFPNGVRVIIDKSLEKSHFLTVQFSSRTLMRELQLELGYDPVIESLDSEVGTINHTFILGDVPQACGLRITFDGWIAKVGPTSLVSRLPEREYCPLVGITAGALAVSEVFLEFAQVNIEAGSRAVALSLWRPDLEPSDSAAQGVPLEILPSCAWILGLGHLGQGYLWALATLPYATRDNVEFFLNDFDRAVAANVETGILLKKRDIGKFKTRVCARWLERRGFKARLVERRFGTNFRCDPSEPQISLCGFDNNVARRALGLAEFSRVVESGLGGTLGNFDAINIHTLPGTRNVNELWPDETTSEAESIATNNSAYQDLADECGRIMLAGKAIAVPFVGATAGTLVVAEALRMLHGGPSFAQLKLRLGSPSVATAVSPGSYGSVDVGGLGHVPARVLFQST